MVQVVEYAHIWHEKYKAYNYHSHATISHTVRSGQIGVGVLGGRRAL